MELGIWFDEGDTAYRESIPPIELSPIEQQFYAELINKSTGSYGNTLKIEDEKYINNNNNVYHFSFYNFYYPQEHVLYKSKKYILDFQVEAYLSVCNIVTLDKGVDCRLMVAVELDGHEFHEKTKEQARKDKQRERDLMELGYIIIRFTGSEVYNNVQKCVFDMNKIIRNQLLNKLKEIPYV